MADRDVPAMLAEFHQAFGQPFGHGDITDSRLRIALHLEENRELIEALLAGDLTATAHELADVVYVAYGTAHSLGIPLHRVIVEVHRANMSKIGPDGPEYREDGKLLKPPTFRAAEVAAVLAAARPESIDPADTAKVGDQLGQAWVEEQVAVSAGGCRAIPPNSVTWICTRSPHPGRQHVATIGGKVVAVWPSAPLPAVPDGEDATVCACCHGDPLTVCAACEQHACWAGRFMCEFSRTAGTKQAAPAGDGEDALEPDVADPDDVRQALRAALRARDAATDEMGHLQDQLDRAHALNRKQHRELVQLTMVPPLPFGEDVPARLDAAADAAEAMDWPGMAYAFRDLAGQLDGDDAADVRAAVAAALARPTGAEQ